MAILGNRVFSDIGKNEIILIRLGVKSQDWCPYKSTEKDM
jgi:hypothetical protein